MVILTIENRYRYTGHHTCHDRSPVCQIPTPAARMQGLVKYIMQPLPFVFGMSVNSKNMPSIYTLSCKSLYLLTSIKIFHIELRV